jgi:hypothetical protein
MAEGDRDLIVTYTAERGQLTASRKSSCFSVGTVARSSRIDGPWRFWQLTNLLPNTLKTKLAHMTADARNGLCCFDDNAQGLASI